MHQQEFEIEKSDGTKIRGDIYAPSANVQPAVIFVHGLKGHRNWGFLPRLRDAILSAGLAAVIFDFSRASCDPINHRIIDVELFGSNTMSIELEDVLSVVDALDLHAIPGSEWIDPSRLGLFGTSRGGAAAICAAALRQPRVRALFTQSAVATTQAQRLSAEELQAWRTTGRFREIVAESGQEVYLGAAALEDMEAHPDRIEQSARNLHIPYFIVHGSADPMTPEMSANLLHDWVPHSEIEILDGADHGLSITRPYTTTTVHLERTSALMTRFFIEHL